MDNVYVGTTEAGERVYLRLELTEHKAVAPRQSINHKPVTEMLELTMSVSTMLDGKEYRGGQAIEALRELTEQSATLGPYTRAQIARLVWLWETHHLNGMKAACAHQGEQWTCTGAADGPHGRERIVNGRSVLRSLFGENPWPKDPSTCRVCGRLRWDEPSDTCPHSGYRYGTAWLSYAIPEKDLAELRALEAIGRSRPAGG